MLKTGAGVSDARRWLAKTGGSVRQALAAARVPHKKSKRRIQEE
jgi:hypothetical protein